MSNWCRETWQNESVPIEKIKYFTYKNNRNDVVIRYKNAKKLMDNFYITEITKDKYDQEETDLVIKFDSDNVGMCFGTKLVNDFNDENMFCKERIYSQFPYAKSVSNYESYLDSKMNVEDYIKDAEIKLALESGITPHKVAGYMNMKRKQKEFRETKELEKQKRIAENDKAHFIKKNKEANDVVNDAINTIKIGKGVIENKDIVFGLDITDPYKTSKINLIHYIANKYNVKVPLKTMGYICNKICSYNIDTDNNGNFGFNLTVYTKNNRKPNVSEGIYKYLFKIFNAVRNEYKPKEPELPAANQAELDHLFGKDKKNI